MKIYISDINNPYYNVSLEYELMKKSDDVSLFLWQNIPTVFVGRNQNIYENCDLTKMKELDVTPVRRLSGGGTVYQDMGNINYSFFSEVSELNEEKLQGILIKALEILGIKAEFSGRNDVLYDGKKISGQAYYEEDGHTMLHGTLLYNVDMEKLSKVLTPSKIKLEAKGIKSVKSRVINLKQDFPNLTIDEIKKAFINAMDMAFNEKSEVIHTNLESDFDKNLFNKLQTKEWIFGEEPDFDVKLEERFDIGNVSIYLKIHDGKIKSLDIYTDSLKNIDFKKAKEKLIGIYFDKEKILEIIKTNI